MTILIVGLSESCTPEKSQSCFMSMNIAAQYKLYHYRLDQSLNEA